ncbi:MAG: plasmid pRiA4b ORF-3 family protein [Polyangiaceae bacterium]
MPITTLKVTLRHVQPPVWRRLRVPSSVTLADLHTIFQVALGWSGGHMHMFRIARDHYGVADREDPDTQNEKKMTLDDVAKTTSRFVYAYDMGDGWEHDVVIEKTEPSGDLTCLDGKRAVPPEDCGGPHGYENLLEALADPKHPEHASMKEWVGPYWKAEHFDIALVNKELGRLAARWSKRAAAKPRLRLVKPATQ